MSEKDLKLALSNGFSRLDVSSLLDAQSLGSHELGIADPAGETDDYHYLHHSGTEERDYYQDKEEGWHHHEYVDESAEDHIHLASEEACDSAEERTDNGSDQG